MKRLDFPVTLDVPQEPRERASEDEPFPPSPPIDRVPWDCPSAREIGFALPERYNASEILFQNVAAGRGGQRAVIGPAGERTYGQVCADAARWGNGLLRLGLKRGDRVILMLDDTPVYPAAFFGAIRAGLVPILINVLTTPDLLRFYICDSQAKAAIVEAGFSDRFAAALDDGARSKAAGFDALIVVNGEACPAIFGVKTLHERHWLAGFSETLPVADTHRDDMAFWMYSSGSTGNPKGIVHLQHDMLYTHLSYGRHVLQLRPGDICFSVPKIFFSYGFGNSITFPFAVGATSLLMPGRAAPAAVFAAVVKYRPTVFFGLPTLYTILMNAPEIKNADFSSVRLAVSAAEILSVEACNAWKTATGLDIVECLGSTEMLNVYLSNTPERKRSGAAGLRVPGYEIVLKDEHGAIIADDREGTMWIRGHSGTPQFWNNPERTAQVIGDGGWMCTGDRFVRDRDGFYFFRGRIDDLVKISGQWVNPIEVQRCLGEHPAVRECAVLAVRLPDRRMALKAFVVMNKAAFDAEQTAQSLQDYVKRTLLPFKYPRLIQFMRELPKTGTGKVDRQALIHFDEGTAAAEPMSRRPRRAFSRAGATL